MASHIKCIAVHKPEKKPQRQKKKLINSQLSRTIFRAMRTFFLLDCHTLPFYVSLSFSICSLIWWLHPFVLASIFFPLLYLICYMQCKPSATHFAHFACDVFRSSSKFLLCFNKSSIWYFVSHQFVSAIELELHCLHRNCCVFPYICVYFSFALCASLFEHHSCRTDVF